MKKVNDMSLKEILDITDVMLKNGDISKFCNDAEVIKEYLKIYDEENFNNLKEYLISKEDKIDKKKLLFCLYLNYKTSLKIIDDKMATLNNNASQSKLEIQPLTQYQLIQNHNMETKKLMKNMEETKKLMKNIDTYLEEIDIENGKLKFTILSSKEEVEKKRKSEKRKLKKWKSIDESTEGKKNGTIYMLNLLVLTDLYNVLQDREIGVKLRQIVLVNAVLNEKGMTINQLKNIEIENFEEYKNLLENTSPEFYLPELRETLTDNIRFIDIDKLLLICAYRLEEYAEKNEINNREDKENFKNNMEFIEENIENRNISFKETLCDQLTYEPREIEYSFQDIKKFINRWIGDTYISKIRLEQTKQALLEGDITLNILETPILNLIDLNKSEIEKIMYYSSENFVYGINKLNYNLKQIEDKLKEHPEVISVDLISDLYNLNKISIDAIIQMKIDNHITPEFFKKFSEEVDTSSEINLQKINEQYLKIKAQQQPSEEEKSRLNTLLELYKIVNIDGKTQEEKEEQSNDIMYEIAEDFEDENDLLFYYRNGLLTLNTVAEWSGDNLIEQLYNESEITFKNLEELYNSKKIKQSTIEKAILKDEIDEEKLNLYVSLGYLSDEAIIKLRKASKFYIKDAKEWEKQGLISKQLLKKLEDIDIKELEDKSNTHASELIKINDTGEEFREFVQYDIEKFSDEEDIDEFWSELDLSGLEGKEKKDLIKNTKEKPTPPSVSGEKTTGVIDPNVRLAFLKALGCKIPKKLDMGEHPENSPFKDYNIFIISEDEKELKKDSIIIAEQLYKNKEDKRELAIDSATYIMRWEDLCILNNNQKDEQKGKLKALEERDGVIYRTYHRTKGMIETLNAFEEKEASEDINIKTGSWAKNVLKKVAYAKAGGKIQGKHDDEALEAYRYLEKTHKNEDIMEIVKKRYMQNKSKYKNKQLGQAVVEIAREEGFVSGNESEEMAIYNCLRTMYTVEELNKIAILVDYIDNGIPPNLPSSPKLSGEDILDKEEEITSVEFPVWELIRDVPRRSKKGFDQTDDDNQR